jgi:hypothetical protein
MDYVLLMIKISSVIVLQIIMELIVLYTVLWIYAVELTLKAKPEAHAQLTVANVTLAFMVLSVKPNVIPPLLATTKEPVLPMEPVYAIPLTTPTSASIQARPAL